MKASDFRIGNIVDLNGRFVEIESIDDRGINLDVESGYSGAIDFNYDGYFVGRQFWSNDAIIKPIPITPEILLKAGFEKDKHGDYLIDLQTHALKIITGKEDLYYPLYCQHPEMSHEYDNIVGLHRIKHLHQLQNLYFALTGEELDVKL